MNRTQAEKIWRRDGDSNPRYPFGAYTISNRAPSASSDISPSSQMLRRSVAAKRQYTPFAATHATYLTGSTPWVSNLKALVRFSLSQPLTATERIRHFFHLSNILRKKNRTRARLPLLQKLADYAWSIALQYRLYCFLYSIGKTKSKKKSNKIQINFVHLVKSIIFIRFFFVNNARVRSV